MRLYSVRRQGMVVVTVRQYPIPHAASRDPTIISRMAAKDHSGDLLILVDRLSHRLIEAVLYKFGTKSPLDLRSIA